MRFTVQQCEVILNNFLIFLAKASGQYPPLSMPENIITLIQSVAKAVPKNDTKPDWSQKTRSGLWKFTATLIWVVACIGGAALFVYRILAC